MLYNIIIMSTTTQNEDAILLGGVLNSIYDFVTVAIITVVTKFNSPS